MMNSIEGTGEKFDLATFFEAQRICKMAVRRVALKVASGMVESDGQKLVKDEFSKLGISKFWHPTKFRIGADTTKNFRELPDPFARIVPGTLFFIDVGPIYLEHEADYGETFLFNDNDKGNDIGDDNADDSKCPEMADLAVASERIWHETARLWREEHLTGKSLYERAALFAKASGYKLNPLMAGHRLGDFPHALHSKLPLAAAEFTPSANLWVLEVHLVSERLNGRVPVLVGIQKRELAHVGDGLVV